MSGNEQIKVFICNTSVYYRERYLPLSFFVLVDIVLLAGHEQASDKTNN